MNFWNKNKDNDSNNKSNPKAEPTYNWKWFLKYIAIGSLVIVFGFLLGAKLSLFLESKGVEKGWRITAMVFTYIYYFTISFRIYYFFTYIKPTIPKKTKSEGADK